MKLARESNDHGTRVGIEIFDWSIAQKSKGPSANPTGTDIYLVSLNEDKNVVNSNSQNKERDDFYDDKCGGNTSI